jgi:hypothetical protein
MESLKHNNLDPLIASCGRGRHFSVSVVAEGPSPPATSIRGIAPP